MSFNNKVTDWALNNYFIRSRSKEFIQYLHYTINKIYKIYLVALVGQPDYDMDYDVAQKKYIIIDCSFWLF